MKKLIMSICCMVLLITSHTSGIPSVCADGFSVEGVKSACLMDFSSGDVLYELNSDKKLPIASMVKLMTILLTFEELDAGNINLNDKVTASERASGMGGSQVFIDANEEYKLEDLLKSVIMASANDASVALAEHIFGSEENFVSKMNNRAKELKMLNTNYKNCTGLPAPEQYSSAKDTTILNRELLSHEDYHKYSTIWMDKLVHPSGRETELVNTNKLIRYYKDCDSGKTGSTDEAGCCLSASAKRDGMRVISTICGAENSKTRFNQCSSLFNYAFANYGNQLIIDKNIAYAEINTKGAKQSTVKLVPSNDYYATVKKSDKNTKFSFNISVPEVVKAPIKKGDKVGELIIFKDVEQVATIDLISEHDVDKMTYADAFDRVITNWTL